MGKLLFCLVQMPLPWESLLPPLDGSAPQVISRCLGDISNWMLLICSSFKGISLVLYFQVPSKALYWRLMSM